MKKLGLLVALAMIAGSASAVYILPDTDWATATLYLHDNVPNGEFGSGVLNSSADVAGDPGYNFNVTVDEINDTGTFLYGFVEMRVAYPSVPGDIISMTVQNTSATAGAQYFIIAYMDDDADPFQNRFASADQGLIAAGDTSTMTLDVTGRSVTGISLWMGASSAFGGTTIDTTVIPEPATFGLFAVFGGAALFVRKKFMI